MSAKTSSNGNDDDKNNTNTNTTNRSTGANANADATLAAKARVRGRDLLVYGQRQIDRVVSPAARQKVIDATTVFASNRPLLSVCQLTYRHYLALQLHYLRSTFYPTPITSNSRIVTSCSTLPQILEQQFATS